MLLSAMHMLNMSIRIMARAQLLCLMATKMGQLKMTLSKKCAAGGFDPTFNFDSDMILKWKKEEFLSNTIYTA